MQRRFSASISRPAFHKAIVYSANDKFYRCSNKVFRKGRDTLQFVFLLLLLKFYYWGCERFGAEEEKYIIR